MPDCDICPPNGYQLTRPGNIEALEIIDEYINFMFGAMGMPSITAITHILTIEEQENRDTLEKIMLYVQVASRERMKTNEPHRVIKKSK